MLEAIREFAVEELGQGEGAATIKDRHVQAFLALAQQAQPHMFGGQRKDWLDRLEMEHDNFRAALDWTIARDDARTALQLSGSLWRFWQMRGHIHEGRARMAQVLAMPNNRGFFRERLLGPPGAGGPGLWAG